MQFVRLRLQGFKSFVDPTEMPIAPGLTGVVGPNGCGKSNLLEAIRWVMGETSAKSMRGDGMEDVIFAGAANRPPRAFAEVSLQLDNQARRAPAAFNEHDRLDVARRIAREAGSVYRVNGRESRARDVRMLFADAAIGAHSPALVRQGRISELVNAKPTARRAILEEAAGVSGLHQRRHEATLKLDAASRNLEGVDEQLSTLDARLAQLERQARQAARYRAVAEQLRTAELALLVSRWREADAARAEADAAATAAATGAAEAQRRASAAARAASEAQEALAPLREEAMVAAAVLQRATIERDRLDERAAEAKREAEAAAQRLAQLDGDAEREAQLAEEAGDALARLERELHDLARAREGRDEALSEARDGAERAEAVWREADAAADAARDETARLIAEAEAAARRAQETDRAAVAARKAALDAESEADALARRLDELSEAEARATDAAEAAAAALEAAEGEAAAAEAAREAARAAASEAKAAKSEAEGARAALRSEADGLEKLLATEGADGDAVLESVRVAPGWEDALGAALGDDLSAPLAEEGGGWRALPGVAADAPPPGAEPLAPHVEAPAALARRLARVAVVDRAEGDAAQRALAPGWRLVSREGDLWRWDGLARRAGESASDAARRLARKNRLDALRADLAGAVARAAETMDAASAAEALLSEAGSRDAAAREARREAERRSLAATRAAASAASSREAAESRLAALADALERRRSERAEAEAAADEAAAALDAAPDPASLRARAAEAKRAAEEARRAATDARGAVEEIERRDAARARRLAAAERERDQWRRRRNAAGERAAEFARRIDRAREAAENAAEAPKAIEADRARLASTLKTAEARRAEADDALAAAEAAARARGAEARDAERAAAEAGEARAGAAARLEAEARRAEEAEGRLRESCPEGVETALSRLGDAPLRDPDAAEIEAARLRRQREALGAVNLRAEEDAREVAAERDRLATERADLEAAIAKLRQGVAELNREGRRRLLEAFDEVDATFRQLFTTLFGGGEARLQLVESEDPLDAGLEIMAMPPGKKLATLSLLSGGEQTLTALALIFSVFLVNPSPICVLDEVDAPLDDANVGRFCDLLDEMTRRTATRFLIITHHPVTMSRMDRLFGVTMAEQGVSQLVSVDLARAAEMAAE